jgi:hypothetical protein
MLIYRKKIVFLTKFGPKKSQINRWSKVELNDSKKVILNCTSNGNFWMHCFVKGHLNS